MTDSTATALISNDCNKAKQSKAKQSKKLKAKRSEQKSKIDIFAKKKTVAGTCNAGA
jgi:hypothetical protein